MREAATLARRMPRAPGAFADSGLDVVNRCERLGAGHDGVADRNKIGNAQSRGEIQPRFNGCGEADAAQCADGNGSARFRATHPLASGSSPARKVEHMQPGVAFESERERQAP